jgi:hypothetical protein
MTLLHNGTRIYLDDGRTGTITQADPTIGKYFVWPDQPTDDEFIRNTHHLIRFEDAREVEETV